MTANAPTLKLKRGAQANLPTLAVGEPGFTTDSYQLYVGSPSGNKLIGGNDFFSLEGTTSGGGINLYEGTDNGSDYIQLKSPDSLTGVTTYTFPASPTNGYFLKTNATGTLSWEEVATSLVEDTTPQLGGNLDLNSSDITGTGNINITGVVTATNVTVGSTSFGTLNQNVDNLVTLSGVNVDSVNLGSFTGSTISDNRTLKQALQDLETSLESVSGGGAQASSIAVGSTDADATHYLTFVDGLNANPTQESIQNDAGITYNPSSNLLTVGEISATTLDIGGTNVTSTAAELNILDGVTADATELNILDGVTATTAELNLLDGVTATTTELNYVDGVTSAIQTQLDAKQATVTDGDGLAFTGATLAVDLAESIATALTLTGLTDTEFNTTYTRTSVPVEYNGAGLGRDIGYNSGTSWGWYTSEISGGRFVTVTGQTDTSFNGVYERLTGYILDGAGMAGSPVVDADATYDYFRKVSLSASDDNIAIFYNEVDDDWICIDFTIFPSLSDGGGTLINSYEATGWGTDAAAGDFQKCPDDAESEVTYTGGYAFLGEESGSWYVRQVSTDPSTWSADVYDVFRDYNTYKSNELVTTQDESTEDLGAYDGPNSGDANVSGYSGGGDSSYLEFQSNQLAVSVKDEDNMASDSADHLATQQSIKAYADTKLADIVSDTTPQLGGNLDLNSSDITGTGSINITGVATATSFSGSLTGDVNAGILTATSSFTLAGVSVTSILDEDNMSSDSATALATQQSIKAYVDTEINNVSTGTVAVGSTDADATHYLTFVVDNNTNPAQENLRSDAGVTYNPNSNLLTVGGELTVTTLDIGGTNVTSTATELNLLDGSTADGEAVAGKAIIVSPDLNLNNLGVVTATTFTGALTGDVTGNVTGNVSGDLTGDVNAGIVTASTSLTLNGTSVTAILDEDTLSSNSATSLATQQSIKAYVDSQVGGENLTGGDGITISTDTITVDLKNDSATAVTLTGLSESLFNVTLTKASVPGRITSNDFAYNSGTTAYFYGSENTSGEEYLEVTNASNSSFNATYRRYNGFVLDTGTVASGSAAFHADTTYDYFHHVEDYSILLIYSESDADWVFVDRNGFTTITDGSTFGLTSPLATELTTWAGGTSGNSKNQPSAAEGDVNYTGGWPLLILNNSWYVYFAHTDPSTWNANIDNVGYHEEGKAFVDSTVSGYEVSSGIYGPGTDDANVVGYSGGGTTSSYLEFSQGELQVRVLDEDNLVSASSTHLATQQSIKAYVDANSISDIVSDTTPQLGGNLDLNSSDITGTGNINITGDITVSDQLTAVHGNFTGVGTFGTISLAGVAVTAILDEDGMTSDRADAIPTQQSVKAYVDAVDLTTALGADSGSGSVATSQTLTVSGTANETTTSVSGQTITIGLSDTVNITTELDVPTIEVTDIQARDGTASITITNSTGAVSIADSLTVSGDLYVNGTQTYVNTTQMTVEDTLIELQVVDGGSLSSDTNKDVGLIFNYYTTEALKAAVFWDDSTSRIGIAQSVSESSGVLTVNNDQWATIEVGGLTVSDSVGVATAVITVSGSDRVLQNVLIDAGSF